MWFDKELECVECCFIKKGDDGTLISDCTCPILRFQPSLESIYCKSYSVAVEAIKYLCFKIAFLLAWLQVNDNLQ